ncbi:MAG: hypothetical protein HPPSJP_4940 [Candidatus Hepatoplasma scabrum]|nr:MAG: hypothetical protein HPPSJP_4940 [Candidatus Hepatoplasma sp.]
MKKYYAIFLIPLIGVMPINRNISEKNISAEQTVITDFSAGGHHSGIIVDTDNDYYADTLYMWGDNEYGEIGNGKNFETVSTPQIIDYDFKGNLINLELGVIHSGVTVDSDYDGYADTLYMWGDNDFGQVGNGTSGDENMSVSPEKITPEDQDNWNGNIVDLSLSAMNTSVSIDTDYDGYADTLYVWGSDMDGQIGNESIINVLYPTIITPSEKDSWEGNIIDVSLDGYSSGVTIDSDYDGYADTLYMWGRNNYGQIGNDSFANTYLPTIITPKNQTNWSGNIIDFDLGTEHAGLTIDSDYDGYADTLYMWGDNYYGQSGNGTFGPDYEYLTTPQLINFNFNGNIIDISLGGTHSAVITDSNSDNYADTLYVWGNSYFGQVGDGTSRITNQETPLIITPKDQDNWNGNILKLSLGFNTTGVVIDQNNDNLGDTLYMWGQNSFYECGNPNLEVYYPEITINFL